MTCRRLLLSSSLNLCVRPALPPPPDTQDLLRRGSQPPPSEDGAAGAVPGLKELGFLQTIESLIIGTSFLFTVSSALASRREDDPRAAVPLLERLALVTGPAITHALAGLSSFMIDDVLPISNTGPAYCSCLEMFQAFAEASPQAGRGIGLAGIYLFLRRLPVALQADAALCARAQAAVDATSLILVKQGDDEQSAAEGGNGGGKQFSLMDDLRVIAYGAEGLRPVPEETRLQAVESIAFLQRMRDRAEGHASSNGAGAASVDGEAGGAPSGRRQQAQRGGRRGAAGRGGRSGR